jgi:allantoinase
MAPRLPKLPSHGRYRYTAITRRPDYNWPGRRRLAVYVGFNVEHFAFGEGLGAALVSGRTQPDVLNFSWRDYGNRVGTWRCIELFDALKLPVGAIVNTSIYDYCPEVATAMRERRYEFIGHGHTNSAQQGILPRAGERKLIARCTARMRTEEGISPRGWLSPWISESVHTPDLLQKAGYRYNLNWCHDDQPMRMTAGAVGLWTIPYPQEINDIPAVMGRLAGAAEFADMIVHNFDEMLEQSKAQPLVMGIALHPYIVGQPFRLRYLRRALKHVVAGRRAWMTTPGAIANHMDALVKTDRILSSFFAEP